MINDNFMTLHECTFGMVEEHKEWPVDKPRALLEGLEWRGGHVALNEFLEAIQIFKGILPVLSQDLWSKLSPQAIQEVLVKTKMAMTVHSHSLWLWVWILSQVKVFGWIL